mgnify:FL=1
MQDDGHTTAQNNSGASKEGKAQQDKPDWGITNVQVVLEPLRDVDPQQLQTVHYPEKTSAGDETASPDQSCDQGIQLRHK